MKDWAQSIANLLMPGGVFMIRDDHPLLFALDNEGLMLKSDYFSGTESTYEAKISYKVNEYASNSEQLIHSRNP